MSLKLEQVIDSQSKRSICMSVFFEFWDEVAFYFKNSPTIIFINKLFQK